nr:MAG TPA: hypothetical protein [Caudoviricetes sp.]
MATSITANVHCCRFILICIFFYIVNITMRPIRIISINSMRMIACT